MLRWLSRIAVIGLGLGAVSCQTLPDIQVSVCGNYIVEPGEDCDGFIDADLTSKHLACGGAGTAHACRFDCSQSASACPAGYVCGGDSICRTPIGQFSILSSIPATSPHVLMGDFDADGRSDLVTVDDDSGQIDVYFVGQDGVVARSFSSPSDGAVPGIGRLSQTSPDNDDLAFAVSGGVGVIEGEVDRSFAPKAYTSIALPSGWNDVTLLAIDVIDASAIDPISAKASDLRWVGDEILLVHQGAVYAPDSGANITAPNSWAVKLPVAGPWKTGQILTGHLDVDPYNSPCEEIVLPDTSSSLVHVVTPCLRGLDGKLRFNNKTPPDADGINLGGDPQTTYPPVTLPAGVKVTGVRLAQFNPTLPSTSGVGRDLYLDLVIGGSDGKVYVAYGLGNGRFRSTPPLLGDLPNDSAGLLLGIPELPLAVQDLNDDGVPDFVFPETLAVSVTGTNKYAVAGLPLSQSRPWTDAVIVDFNGDGRLDVVASSNQDLGIQLFTNAGGGAFNPDLIATSSPASQFVVADYDGDLQPDIAFRHGRTDGAASLGVLFGRLGEPPLPPRYFGQLAGIDQVVAGVDLGSKLVSDQVSDLGVLTHGTMSDSIAAFAGRPDRLLSSPYLFRANPTSPVGATQLESVTVGRFFAETEGLPDTADLAAIFSSGAPKKVQGTVQRDTYLWLVRTSGDADLAAYPDTVILGSRKDSQMHDLSTVSWASAVMVPMDVDGDGTDELVLLAPIVGSTKAGALFVASAGEQGFELGDMISVDEGFVERNSLVPIAGAPRRNAQPCVARIDDDEFADLVALTFDGADPPNPRITVFFGTGKKDAPFSLTDTAHVTFEGVAAGERINGFACIQADGDDALEIVIVTDQRTILAGADGSRKIAGVALKGLPGGIGVATGNINDDRIADLVIAQKSSTVLYLGKAKNP
jgi:hypothetical protein